MGGKGLGAYSAYRITAWHGAIRHGTGLILQFVRAFPSSVKLRITYTCIDRQSLSNIAVNGRPRPNILQQKVDRYFRPKACYRRQKLRH